MNVGIPFEKLKIFLTRKIKIIKKEKKGEI